MNEKQLKNKFDSLQKHYYEVKKHNEKSRNDHRVWELYGRMHNLLAHKKSAFPSEIKDCGVLPSKMFMTAAESFVKQEGSNYIIIPKPSVEQCNQRYFDIEPYLGKGQISGKQRKRRKGQLK